jgi:HEPN domain-containing protein
MSGSGDRRRGVDRKKERLRALLYLAEQDTEAAKLLAAHNNHYAAYHCQQAAEKLIRVLLIHHDIEPGLDHHLDILVAKLPENEPWKARLAPLHKYTPYATTYRYATPGGRVPTSPEADGVAADAAHIFALIADARSQLVGN